MKREYDTERFVADRLSLQADDLIWVTECGSTMDLAREVLSSMPSRIRLVATNSQTAGRGRQGRSWLSVGGAFQGTFTVAVQGEPNPATTLVVGLAVIAALERLHVQGMLKWPNDIISTSGRKLGGILTEYVASPACYLIGIGLNLRGANFNVEKQAVGSVEAEYGTVLSAPQFCVALWEELLLHLEKLQVDHFSHFRERWNSKAAFLEHLFTVEVGQDVLKGVFKGVSESGAMLLESEGKVLSVTSGHIIQIA